MLAPCHGELDTHPPEKALHEAISVHRDRIILFRLCPALYGLKTHFHVFIYLFYLSRC